MASARRPAKPNLPAPAPKQSANPQHKAIWKGIESGAGEWENVPLSVRSGLQVLLAMLQHADSGTSELRFEQLESQNELLTRIEQLEAAFAKQTQQAQHLHEALSSLQRAVSERPTAAAVAEYLHTKADRDAVTAVTARQVECLRTVDAVRVRVESCESRVDSVQSRASTFEQEAQGGIITATRAANEARTAVNTALAALAALQSAPPPARADDLSALAARVDVLVDQARGGRVDSGRDANIVQELAESVQRLEQAVVSKADKDMVVAALGKKLSTSKLPDALSALASRLESVEARVREASSGRGQPVADTVPVSETRLVSLERDVARLESSMGERFGTVMGRVQAMEGAQGQVETLRTVVRELGNRAQAGPSQKNDVESLQAELRRVREEVSELQQSMDRALSSGKDRGQDASELQNVQREVTAASVRLDGVAASQQRVERQVQHLASAVERVQGVVDGVESLSRSVREEARGAGEKATAAVETASRVAATLHSRLKTLKQESTAVGGSKAHDALGMSDASLRLELTATREQVSSLARELQGVLSLLEVSGVHVPSERSSASGTLGVGSGMSSHAQPAAALGVGLSTATAVTTLRELVAALSERVQALEGAATEARRGLCHAHADAVEMRDTLLRHTSAIGQVQVTAAALVDRIAAVEAGIGSSLSQAAAAAVQDARSRANREPLLWSTPQSQVLHASRLRARSAAKEEGRSRAPAYAGLSDPQVRSAASSAAVQAVLGMGQASGPGKHSGLSFVSPVMGVR